MLNLPSRLLTSLLLLTTVTVSRAQPIAIRDFAKATGDNVVRIEAQWSNGASQSGFGYIVGVAGRRMTVATARHVLAAQSNGEFQGAQRIDIITRNGDRHIAEKIAFNSDVNGSDLGFFDFVSTGTLRFSSIVLSLDVPNAAEEVWLMGSRGEFRLSPASGRISGTTNNLVRVSALGGVAGVSGAPVLSARGVIGLYLGGDPIANVLRMTVIQQQAAAINRTWTVTSTPASLPTISVQFVRADTLNVGVSIASGATPNGFPIPGTRELSPGGYMLSFDIKRVECAPRSFLIEAANPSQRIEIFCTPRLDGSWSSSEVNAVVSALGNGDYEVTTVAKNNLPSNALRGRLIQTNTVNEYQTNLTDLLGRERSGTMTVSSDLTIMNIVIPLSAAESRTLTLRRQ